MSVELAHPSGPAGPGPSGPAGPRPGGPGSPPAPPRPPARTALPWLAYVALALALTAGTLGADVIWLGLGHPVTSSTVLFHLAALFVLGQGIGLALARRATPTERKAY